MVTTIRYGQTNTYLIKGESANILILVSELMKQGIKLILMESQQEYVHYSDSISIILDEGICIVGDLEPLDYLEAYNDNKALRSDWDRILTYKPARILYAHANEKELRY